MPKTIPAQRWLDHLHDNLTRARRGEPEGVHQLRAGAGRLAVWLWLGERRVLRDDLRWLRRSAARVRDLDVALEHPEAAPMRSWLAEERVQAQAELEVALRAPRVVALFEGLENLPPLRKKDARRRARELARRVRKAGRRLDPDEVESVHDVRRALRRWRYALEWLGDETRRVRRAQDELGEIGDLRLVLTLLDRPERPIGLDGHRNHVRSEIARRSQAFAAGWKARERKLERVMSETA